MVSFSIFKPLLTQKLVKTVIDPVNFHFLINVIPKQKKEEKKRKLHGAIRREPLKSQLDKKSQTTKLLSCVQASQILILSRPRQTMIWLKSDTVLLSTNELVARIFFSRSLHSM